MTTTDTMRLRQLRRGREETLPIDALLERCAAAERVWFDAGCGDGRFPYRQARENPGSLCIGIDPVAENLRETAGRIGRKPARGGVDNLVLLVGAIEQLPPELTKIADVVAVNFPWGALLRGVAEPDEAVLAPLAGLLKPGGELRILLNQHVFDDDPLRRRLQLPPLTEDYVDEVLAARYAAVGLTVIERCRLGDAPLPAQTTWGQRLSLGSRRETLAIRARRGE